MTLGATDEYLEQWESELRLLFDYIHKEGISYYLW